MFGNVGTDRRLDLTVTGPAANEVERLESLFKRPSVPLVASQQFKQIQQSDLIPLGRQDVAGIENGLEAYTLPEFEPRRQSPEKALNFACAAGAAAAMKVGAQPSLPTRSDVIALLN